MPKNHWGDHVYEMTSKFGPLAVGIDPVFEHIPDTFKERTSANEALMNYITALLETVKGMVGFVKFQSAFFEAFGWEGVRTLSWSIAKARECGLRVILDAKRGDIGSTASAYARAYLTPTSAEGSNLEVDCMTINPFLGIDTLQPFVDCAKKFGKGLFVLVKTSNEGAGWIQNFTHENEIVSERIARVVNAWAEETLGERGLSAIGAVVGITYPEDGHRIRNLMPDSVFLAPGFGPQGGSLEAFGSLMRSKKHDGVVVPMSRAITMPDNILMSEENYRALLSERIETYQSNLKKICNMDVS